jgi:predicted phage terminase large subunit-like protein
MDPVTVPDLTQLSDDELILLGAEADRLSVYESPAAFAQVLTRHDSEPWLPYNHLIHLNTYLLRLVDGDINRLMITMPPRHGKSLLVSLHFPIWYLNLYPDRRIILCSYGDDYASEWGRRCRDLIRDHPEHLQIRVNEASKAADRWDIEGRRGGMKTAGVGGQITGRGAHLFIIDDPVKDAVEANSAVDRAKKWEWWRTTAQSRLEPQGAVALIQTRWHEDDLAGRLLRDEGRAEEGGRWTLLNLPAIAEDDDPLGRVPGAALCPERYDESYFSMLTGPTGIGNQAFSALYQQRPQPEGGGFFKKTDFQYWTSDGSEEGHIYLLQHQTEGVIRADQEKCWRFITMDLAFTTRTSSDYTVAAVWDVYQLPKTSYLILRHVERLRIDGAEHVEMVNRLWRIWKPGYIGIEEGAIGSTTLTWSQRQGVIVRPLKHASKDKVFRAKDAALLTENHRVFFPKRASWMPAWEHELLLFNSGTHDDQVDAFAYAAKEILRGVNMYVPPKEYKVPTIQERCMTQVTRQRKVEHPVLGTLW